MLRPYRWGAAVGALSLTLLTFVPSVAAGATPCPSEEDAPASAAATVPGDPDDASTADGATGASADDTIAGLVASSVQASSAPTAGTVGDGVATDEAADGTATGDADVASPDPSAATSGDTTNGQAGAVTPGTGAGGSAEVGSTTYAVPADALVVSPSGDDGSAGTEEAPLRTVARAIALAPSGRTIVLRAGSYHESVQIPAEKALTLQPYPNEQVWFDGSSAVTGWVRSGTAWVKSGWTAEFDSTPCYTVGGCANSDPDFQFVNSEFPMAAHPDQVWLAGQALRQVESLNEVAAGTFYVDYTGDKLYIGSDPTGREVRASDLVDAIWIRSNGSVVRGIGVQRYGTPIPGMGTIKADAEDVTLENVVAQDNATTGISALHRGVTLRNVSADRNGMLGIHANYADDLSVLSTRATGNNTENFKAAPVAGGIKVTRSRTVQVVDGTFEDNAGTGVWFDESVHDMTLTGNTIAGNAGHGVSVELSAEAMIVDNVIADNLREGVKFNNTQGGQIWNNTFIGNSRTIWVVQDPRSASDRSTPGHDPRQPFPDPTMTWLAGSVTISNNVFSHPGNGSPCVVCVEDSTGRRSAEQMKVTLNGNVYNRASAAAPEQLIVWSTGGGARTFTTLADFTAVTGQERNSAAQDGPRIVSDEGQLIETQAAGVAQPMPAEVADAVGVTAEIARPGVLAD